MNMNRSALLALVLAATAAPLAAQQTPPAPGTPKNVTVPEPRTFTLDNGLKVSMLPFGEVPKVDAQLVVRVGNVNENENEVWLADLMADLMREGTSTRTSQQVSLDAARMGGGVGISVSSDELSVSGSALAESAGDLVRLLADLAMEPAFPESELARLKANRLRSLAVQKSQPQSLALEKFQAVLYPGHPYGRVFPTEAMIQSYTIDQIRAFYQTHIGAARSHLFVVGRFDPAQMEQVVRQAFSGWKAGSPAVSNVPASTPSSRVIHIIDRPAAVQSSMYIGLPVVDPSHPDYVALQVTNMLLGGAFGSRITRNIREDKGYTYSPGSFVSTRFRSGYWAEVADVTTNVTGESLKEIFLEIERLRNEPPPADELRGIQNYMAGNFTLGSASRGGVLGQLRMRNLHGLPLSYHADYVRKVHAVTPAEVQRIARTYLDPAKMVIVIVGDRATVAEQVRPYGTVQ
ncbi:MAG TPA: pitrilysin family protein [Longimicrobiales bacterium]|nr:pitrilysin family protein [Longimicrobiales bacterium]